VTTPSILPVQIDSIPGMLQAERRWVLWNREMRGDKPTKVLHRATRPAQRADATDPVTWADFDAARTAYEDGKSDGVGFVLGEPYFGFDADRCRDPLTAAIHPEARELTALLATYTEISPSATGLHAIGRGRKPGPRCRIGRYELYDSGRFFCMTGHHLSGTPATVEERSRELATLYSRLFFESASANQTTNATRCHDDDDDDALLAAARIARNGAMFEALWAGDTSAYGDDHSSADLALCNLLAFWTGCDQARMDRLFRQSGLCRPKWYERRGAQTYGERTIAAAVAACRDTYSGGGKGRKEQPVASARAAQHAQPVTEVAGGVSLEDFYAYMPTHTYIFAPSRELWPASSVNSRIRRIPLGNADGASAGDEKDKHRTIPASAWLDRQRPVEQMTWMPGQPLIIRDRLVSDGGWIERPGCACFNLYRPPQITLGDAEYAGPWLEHVARVYPDDAPHITAWLAHRVQRPHEKINHALVLGGSQGIGKDTILEPIKAAIGPWNFSEVSPTHLLGRFNGFVKSVILRVSEARDLGDVDRYTFYDHMKVYTAAPPDVLRVDEKHLREYAVWNVCGVVITTNHKADGLYLPADDRRHYVAWSMLTRDDFDATYWSSLYRWYAAGGTEHVAAYLFTLDIADFDPKAPPAKTPAFWDVVDANRAPEDAELADALDKLKQPYALTLEMIASHGAPSFAEWLRDRKSARQVPHRLESAGYVPQRNPDAQSGLWQINGRRQVVYVRHELAPRDRIAAVRDFGRSGQQ
jgi:Family of unknown function (DUF5906)